MVVSFLDLLKGTINAPSGSSVACFFKQLVQGLGKMVDVRDEVAPLQGAAPFDVPLRSAGTMLVKYWGAMSEAFLNPLVLHMALDQGNLGKKPTVCGLIAVPGNGGAIFPPQVLTGTKGGCVFGTTAPALSWLYVGRSVVPRNFRVLPEMGYVRTGPKSALGIFGPHRSPCSRPCQVVWVPVAPTPWPPAQHQVMPSYISNIALAEAWGDQAEQQYCKSEWVNRARNWIRKRRCEETEEAASKTPKKQRKKTAAWLACVDQVLSKSCGTGLDFYRVHPEQILTRDHWSWPRFTVTPDQGPDGLAALYYLRYSQAINVDVIYDMSHGVWRDQELATKEIGQTSWTHLMVVC